MINREIIRIKIVQLTYAYYQNGNKNIDTAEKELFFSLSKAYDLYNYLLSLITAVTKEAQRRYEVAQTRAKREGTAEPSSKFVYNRFALQLAENKQLNDFLSTQKLSWEEANVFIGQLFEKIEQSDIYQEYMASKEDSYECDRELWRKLYKTFIQSSRHLRDQDHQAFQRAGRHQAGTAARVGQRRGEGFCPQALPLSHPQCRRVSALYE